MEIFGFSGAKIVTILIIAVVITCIRSDWDIAPIVGPLGEMNISHPLLCLFPPYLCRIPDVREEWGRKIQWVFAIVWMTTKRTSG
jgi:hypothetical protein